MSGEGSSSRAQTVSEAALEKKKRAEAEQPYRPYVHDIGETGALTGAVMPKNVTRSGVDDMENIGEFFRSPEQPGSRSLSFAALGGPPTPSGPSRLANGESPTGRRGSSMDVEDAVMEANEEDNHEGDDTIPKPQYFPPVKRTPPPQLAASSSRRTPQPDQASLYDALPSPSRSSHQSPYGSASRIPIAIAHRRTSSYPPPSPQDSHHTSPASIAARSAKKSSASPIGEGRKKLTELTNGLSSPGMHEVDSLVPIQDPDSLMEDDDDVEISRDRAASVPRVRPSIAARSSAAASIAATDIETEAGDVSFASTQDEDAGPQATYSDDGREEYDPQPANESQVNEDGPDETLEEPEQAEEVQEEEEDDEDEAEVRAGPSKSSKAGKRVVHESEAEEDAVEDDMGPADDYDDQQDDTQIDDSQVDDQDDEEQDGQDEEQEAEEEQEQQEDQEESEEEAPPPVKSKSKGKEKEVVNPKKPKKSPKKAVQAQRKRLADMSSDSEDDGSTRRSRRKRFAPLEYWRGEKLVYGRRESGQPVVPVVKEVLRLPKEEPKKRANSVRDRSTSAKPKSKRTKRDPDDSASEIGEEYHHADGPPEEYGWDAVTVEHGVVMDFASKTEIERRIAFPSHLLEYRTMPGDANGFKFQKVFGDASFVAAGMLEIPVGGEKPSKPTKDNTYLFYVIEGAVTVKVHRTSFTMAPGGQFMVPRGNQYSLHTISHRPAKLFFAQARKMAADEEDIAPQPAVASKSKSSTTNGKKKTAR